MNSEDGNIKIFQSIQYMDSMIIKVQKMIRHKLRETLRKQAASDDNAVILFTENTSRNATGEIRLQIVEED